MLTLSLLITTYLARADGAATEIFYGRWTSRLNATKEAHADGLRGALFAEYSVADELELKRSAEEKFFRVYPEAETWLFGQSIIAISDVVRGPIYRRQFESLFERVRWRNFRAVTLVGHIQLHFIYPSRRDQPIETAFRVTPGDLIISSDGERIASIPYEDPATLLNEIKVRRDPESDPRLVLSDRLRYRLGRAVRSRLRTDMKNFSLRLNFESDGQSIEVPLYSWRQTLELEDFHRTFFVRWSRGFDRIYRTQRCAELLGRFRRFKAKDH